MCGSWCQFKLASVHTGTEKCHDKVHPTESDQGTIWPTVAGSFSAEENTEEKQIPTISKEGQTSQTWSALEGKTGKFQSDVKTEIHQAHGRYINSLFEGDSGKPSVKLWKSIKVIKRDQVVVPPLKGRNGKLETISKGKAQISNNQYSSVFIDEDRDNMPSRAPTHTHQW